MPLLLLSYRAQDYIARLELDKKAEQKLAHWPKQSAFRGGQQGITHLTPFG